MFMAEPMSSNVANSESRQPAIVNAQEPANGFSMLELLIVISMGLVIAALAVPNVLTAVANMRLRSSASSIVGLIQDGRIRAVQRNRRMDLALVVQGARLLCVDENANAACDATERTIQFPNTVTRLTAVPAGAGAPGVTVDATAGITNPQLASLPSFNPRGIPCFFNAGACPTNNAFVIYLSGAMPVGANTSWAAVTVTPAGRTRSWFWTGNAWTN